LTAGLRILRDVLNPDATTGSPEAASASSHEAGAGTAS
jgi:hypothetical protein